uniref:Uncharacterized protein n=1 Tax=Chromera velia CCMP2878 TaxID=1169474 RepID=A0A0G4GJQ6_9ALVE|eukprot:Cvel_22213.t1-p1 / transcript=Cvel_22213.t1 / gene=Cvel_22213 / organism=Chromera_velia_CCMP2878 / gene_product=hypothetical protein / transcript_product=hypothetical protein / location=Cvel_scaffold2159:9402-12308(+) / protein_length=224 / sequence_SO=supercontig / SO=protein_coding / is_pseudo=false
MASLQSDLEKVKKENAKLQTENGQLREYGSTLVSFVPRELTHLLPPAPSGIEEGAQGSLEHPGLPPKAAPPEASAGAQSANRLLETQLAVAMAEKERLREELSTVRREAGAREKEAASVATGLRDTVCELRVERAVALEQIRHLLGRLEECRNENGRLIATMKAMAEDALNTQSFTPSSGPLRALDPYGLLSRQQQYNDKEFLGRDTGLVPAAVPLLASATAVS